MKTTPLPSQDEIASLLDYDPETGRLTWKPRDALFFKGVLHAPEWVAKIWNANFAGKEAFTSINQHGYRRGTLRNKSYLAHRLIWKLVYGFDPDDIDHIDGNRLNNVISNLRSVTRSVNLRNMRLRDDSTTGAPGVAIQPDGKYAARIQTTPNAYKHLGRFEKLEDAIAARKAAEAEVGYHPNHGRIAA